MRLYGDIFCRSSIVCVMLAALPAPTAQADDEFHLYTAERLPLGAVSMLPGKAMQQADLMRGLR